MSEHERPLFGEVLRTFRERSGMSQTTLAKKVGVHRNSISFWERGEYLPEALSTILELAHELQLNTEETQLLAEARYTTAAVLVLHNLPYQRNPYFTGREQLLQHLHQQFRAGKHVALTQAISGLGGIGKTQTALEYAYRYQESYHNIFWVGADSRETLMTGFVSLAAFLNLPEKNAQDVQRVIGAMKRWLSGHKNWLLILDNVEDLELVKEFVPTAQAGTVLLTTRHQVTEPVAQSIELDSISEAEGALLLLRRTKRLERSDLLENASSTDSMIAQSISRTLGGLPLALDQAAAYILETGSSFEDYLTMYEQRRLDLLQRRGAVPSDHQASVMTTFSLAFLKIEQRNLAAIELLRFCAFLAPDAIPEELITQGAEHLGPVLQTVAGELFLLNETMEVLRTFSLIKRNFSRKTLSLHRLVQAVLIASMEEQVQRIWAERAVRTVEQAFPFTSIDDVNTWVRCQRFVPQALHSAKLISQYELTFPEAARLLHCTANYLRDFCQFEQAESLYQQALALREQHADAIYPDTAATLNNLGRLYTDQGRYEQAEPLLQRTLALREEHVGAAHSDTAESLMYLGGLYLDWGKYGQVEPLLQRALAIFEQQIGPTHYLTMITLRYLGMYYHTQGMYKQAELLYLRALALGEETTGLLNPHLAVNLNTLAVLYQDQGKYEQAEMLLQRALGMQEQELGPTHIETASCLTNLGRLYTSQGKYDQAEPLLQRALSIVEQQAGRAHPWTARCLHELALLSAEQGKYQQAEALYQRAIAIRERVLGYTHRDTARSYIGLGRLYRQQSKYEQAEPLLRQALEIRQQIWRLDHPEVAQSLQELALLYREQGRFEEEEHN